MFCVACMTFAHDVAVQCAMALFFMSRNKNMGDKKHIATHVCCKEGSVFRIWIVYVLCSMYDICV